jgi:hypothetical protein
VYHNSNPDKIHKRSEMNFDPNTLLESQSANYFVSRPGRQGADVVQDVARLSVF